MARQQRPMRQELPTAYQGYNALFGHLYVAQAFKNLGLGSKVLDANGNLKDINGNVIVDDFRGSLTPGFPGFGIAPQYSLGYVADMLEAGVPVVYFLHQHSASTGAG